MRRTYRLIRKNAILYARTSIGATASMQETFFAFRFAVLRDKFGTSWMIINGRTLPRSA
jgi:uncharacterized glyoxalase superfamily protein PhnB